MKLTDIVSLLFLGFVLVVVLMIGCQSPKHCPDCKPCPDGKCPPCKPHCDKDSCKVPCKPCPR